MKNIELLTEKIKSQLKIKYLQIHIGQNFGSNTSNNRSNIRQDLIQKYTDQLTEAEKAEFDDLNQTPKAENVHVSISHMKTEGGYVVSDEKIGFDLEDVARISPAIVHRVCTKEEIKSAPLEAFLWLAKESVFKSSENNENFVLSDIQITSWKKSDDLNIFEAENPKVPNQKWIGTVGFLSDTLLFSIAKTN